MEYMKESGDALTRLRKKEKVSNYLEIWGNIQKANKFCSLEFQLTLLSTVEEASFTFICKLIPIILIYNVSVLWIGCNIFFLFLSFNWWVKSKFWNVSFYICLEVMTLPFKKLSMESEHCILQHLNN